MELLTQHVLMGIFIGALTSVAIQRIRKSLENHGIKLSGGKTLALSIGISN